MKESDIKYTSPCIVEFEFRENARFSLDNDSELKLDTAIGTNCFRNADDEAAVELRIEVGVKENNAPFTLRATFVANFKWPEEMSAEMVDAFLSQNAPALLLSYARPYIAMITNASRFPAYNIPFINFKE